MIGDSVLARILEEMSSWPPSASLEELLKPFAVQLVTRLPHREAVGYRRQECSDRRTEDGYAAAVSYCHHQEREFLTGAGPLPVRVPRLRAQTACCPTHNI